MSKRIRSFGLVFLSLSIASFAFAAPAARRGQSLRPSADAEYVLPLMELVPLPNGYSVHGRVRVLPGETLHLEYFVDVPQGTYTTRVRAHRFPQKVETQSYVCVHQYANVATYDPANIELARTTNSLRWTADTYAGTVTAYRGSGSCYANSYTSLGTTWFVNSCYRPPASGFGYSLWKTVSGEYSNYDFLDDAQWTYAYQWTEIEAYGTAAICDYNATHEGEGSLLLHGEFNTGGGSLDGDCADYAREPIDRSWENCPLVLDLNGDGLHTSAEPVSFDLDADGTAERMTWTNAASEEGFLWMDLDENHRVDNGAELFGTGTLLPDGTRAANGFDALAVYDQPAQGGDGNGVIAVGDRAWGRLRVWVDRNHDGRSSHDELSTLAEAGVDALHLGYESGAALDDAENDHRFRGRFVKTLPGNRSMTLLMEDVFFRSEP